MVLDGVLGSANLRYEFSNPLLWADVGDGRAGRLCLCHAFIDKHSDIADGISLCSPFVHGI